MHGAQAGAVAEVGDHHPAGSRRWVQLRQDAGDVLVGQPVEAVAPHAALGDGRRQGEHLREFGLPAMEGGVEAGHLGQLRRPLGDGADRRQVVRLVQRGERVEAGEPLQYPAVHPGRPGELLAAVDHPVAHGDQLVFLEEAAQELHQVQGCAGVAELAVFAPALLGEDGARRIAGDEMRRAVDALDLPAQAQFRLRLVGGEQGELEAGRAGIEDQDHLLHGFTRSPCRCSRAGPWPSGPPPRRRPGD
ncbi:hypothetical protein D3C78_615100 [compost metagenome]